MFTTFHEMLAARAAARGLSGPEGKERLRRVLIDKYGVKDTLTAAAVNHWFNGTRVPSLSTLIAILDVLDVYGDDRDTALRLAASIPAEKGDRTPEAA